MATRLIPGGVPSPNGSGNIQNCFTIGMRTGGHTFQLIYTEGQVCAAIHQLGRWAEDPRLCFDFDDADELRTIILREARARGA